MQDRKTDDDAVDPCVEIERLNQGSREEVEARRTKIRRLLALLRTRRRSAYFH